MITLDFLNKNMYRKYPFRGTSTHLFTDGRDLPQTLITSIQITTLYNYRKIYIHKIYAKDMFVSILIREVDTNIVLGSFSGPITQLHQTLFLDPVVKEISGSVTIGNPEAIDLINGANYLTPADGRLEDSTIFCFTPPAVTSVTNKGNVATGFITLTTDNILLTESNPQIALSVSNKAKILSNNDFSGELGNCGTPLIKKINTVLPDSDGNIDIFGVDPVKIYVGDETVGVGTPALQIFDVCVEKQKLIPPFVDSDSYYTDIATAVDPEWKSWPQFN